MFSLAVMTAAFCSRMSVASCCCFRLLCRRTSGSEIGEARKPVHGLCELAGRVEIERVSGAWFAVGLVGGAADNVEAHFRLHNRTHRCHARNRYCVEEWLPPWIHQQFLER